MEESAKSDRQLTPQTEKLLREYVPSMALAMRTPLAHIILYSQLISEEKFGPLNEEQRKILEAINQSGKRAVKTFETFVDIHRLIFGSLYLHIEEVDLPQLVQQTVSTIQATVEQKLPIHLPKIWADPIRIQWVLEGLLWMAINASGWGVNSIIALTISFDPNIVTFIISTTGKDNLYFRNDPDDSDLFISRSIIEMHGGQMQVNLQEELKQLEISFTLPIEQNKPVNQEIV